MIPTIAEVDFKTLSEWLSKFGIFIIDPLFTLASEEFPKRSYVVAYLGDQIVGYASALTTRGDLIDVFVDPEHRRKKVASTLLDSIDASLVIVKKENTTFRGFLVATGWRLDDDLVKVCIYRRHLPVSTSRILAL